MSGAIRVVPDVLIRNVARSDIEKLDPQRLGSEVRSAECGLQ